MINSKLLEIKVSKDGYYSGFNKVITFGAMIALILFTTWVVLKPQNANEILSVIQTDTVHIFSAWYMYITFFFVLVCLGLEYYLNQEMLDWVILMKSLSSLIFLGFP